MVPGERFGGYDAIPWMAVSAGLGLTLLWVHGIGFLFKLALVLLLMSAVYRWWCRRAYRMAGDWQGARAARWNSCGPGRVFESATGWTPGWGGRRGGGGGNFAFEDYRRETLRRLEDDQKEFETFLEQLRRAKDKSEFDQFMASRNRRPPVTPDQPETL